ncbi:MAG: dTDP-4-dehydrorhamnose reductase [Spirochaetae bacterium HGW-Spirochaetae-1]|nr:MAG: dTDP-4-dehydrorhamnose reductase [Spirochaetae bacterium HGW-Spirochaetae-1]
MKKKKFLITGSGGQLGREFVRILTEKSIDFTAPDEKECNITDRDRMSALIKSTKPDLLINCAAYNAVDNAEDDADMAYKVNSSAPGYLAEICKNLNIFFIHYSSDYVFDGKKENLYTEKDEPNPLGVYGRSKLEGEKAALETGCNCLIFRLSWVFGLGTQNFLYKLSQWAKANPILKISADEVSVPTYTEDVVLATLMSLEKDLSDLYHLTNTGYASRYELARFYLKTAGLKNLVIPVAMSTFNTKAKRAPFTAMSNENISQALNTSIPTWEDAVTRFIERKN